MREEREEEDERDTEKEKGRVLEMTGQGTAERDRTE